MLIFKLFYFLCNKVLFNTLKYLFLFFVFIDSNKKTYQNYLSIFIITHKDFQQLVTNSIYKIVTDNENSLKLNYSLDVIYSKEENILYPKNIAYAEISKMYYIWKNYRPLPKYIGFNHYRRFFQFGNDIPDLDKIFENYDVILSNATNLQNLVIMQQYKDSHLGNALEEVIEIIKEKKPGYYKTAVNTMNSSTIHFNNLFIMKKEDFIEWGEFIFQIMLEYDKRHNLNNDLDVKNYVLREWRKHEKKKLKINYQRRLESFIVERIANIFYNYKFKKIYEVDVIDYDKITLKIGKKIVMFFCFLCSSLLILFAIFFIKTKIILKYTKINKNTAKKNKIKKIENLTSISSNNDIENFRLENKK